MLFRPLLPIMIVLGFSACKGTVSGGDPAPESAVAGDNYSYWPETDPGKEPYPFGRYRDSVGRRDSVRTVFSAKHAFKAFDEPVLGDHPNGETKIRVLCGNCGVLDFIMTMDSREIVLKITTMGVPYAEYKQDPGRLSEQEAFLFRVLSEYYPIEDTSRSVERRRSLDSLARMYPELRSPAYYLSLMDRTVDPDSLRFAYKEYRVPTSPRHLKEFMAKLDTAGFWSLPRELLPEDLPNDAAGFLLEVHTPRYYKMMNVVECPKLALPLSKVCQQMVDMVWRGDKKIRFCH